MPHSVLLDTSSTLRDVRERGHVRHHSRANHAIKHRQCRLPRSTSVVYDKIQQLVAAPVRGSRSNTWRSEQGHKPRVPNRARTPSQTVPTGTLAVYHVASFHSEQLTCSQQRKYSRSGNAVLVDQQRSHGKTP